MRALVAFCFFVCLLPAQTLDVPLTVEEFAGVKRAAEPVTAGVPLPKGWLADEDRLRLYGPDGKAAPAFFRVVNRWWGDAASQKASIQWVHVDFFADVAARSKTVYRLRMGKEPTPPPPATLKVETLGDDVKVGEVLIYVASEDIEADLKKAKSLGGVILKEKDEIPGVGWFGIFKDPTGNSIALYTSRDPKFNQ